MVLGLSLSSLSRWVHACDALELPGQQREQLDAFIDQLYKDIEKGHNYLPSLRDCPAEILVLWN